MSNVNVTAVILAGGLGTRLQPVLKNKPKVLAEVQDRPFLSYLLQQLHDAGYRRVVLCTGFKADQVRETFGDNFKSLEIIYSQETSPLGTGGALRYAYPYLESDWVLVMNGDSYCDVNFDEFQKKHFAHRTEVSIVVTQISDIRRYGSIRLSNEERVLAFEEKANVLRSGLINAGIYLLSKSLVIDIPENEPISLEKTMFPKWIHNGIYGFETKGKFIDIGIPESLAKASEFF